MEELICQGCGTAIQSEDETQPGFVPQSALNNDTVVCKRCFRLKHYNEVQEVALTDDDFLEMISQIRETKGLVVNIVDIFDFSGSFVRSLQRLTGNNPIILVGNKVDLLPKSTNRNKVIQWLKKSCKEQGLPVQEVLLVSAAKGEGFEELEKAMAEYRSGGDVYIVGSTNVGKSTMINQLINKSTGITNAITTSYFPGTTLGFIEIPLDKDSSLYDTPGIINKNQISHYMSEKDLKVITPAKEIKPRVFQLNAGQTLFLGGLGRIDFEKGERQSFVCYLSNQLPIHRTKTEKADQLYERHLGEMLSPPDAGTLEKLPPLSRQTIRLKENKKDIVFPGLGWIVIPEKDAVVTIHSPKGIGFSIRDSLI